VAACIIRDAGRLKPTGCRSDGQETSAHGLHSNVSFVPLDTLPLLVVVVQTHVRVHPELGVAVRKYAQRKRSVAFGPEQPEGDPNVRLAL
jgi:hypothetical protein